MAGLATTWMSQFYGALQDDRAASDELRDASLRSDLGRWTASLTTVVVRTFEALGMPTAAKGHPCTVLPLKQQEYLGQDVMAFPQGSAGWQFPTAVCELENAASDERVAYSALEGAVRSVPASAGVLLSCRAREGRAARRLAGNQRDQADVN